jgi:hypothetical protein
MIQLSPPRVGPSPASARRRANARPNVRAATMSATTLTSAKNGQADTKNPWSDSTGLGKPFRNEWTSMVDAGQLGEEEPAVDEEAET